MLIFRYMEPEIVASQTESQSKFESVTKVTPLSKYFAMVLFVVLPFLGGYIGYKYSPEKIKEIVVEREVVKEIPINKSNEFGAYTTDSGITQNGLEPNKYSVKDFIDSEEKLQTFLREIENTYASQETFSLTGIYRTYEKTAWGELEQCHGLKLAGIPTNFWHLQTLLSTLGGNTVNHIEDKRLVINLPWSEITEEDKRLIASDEKVTLQLSYREPLFTEVGPCYSMFVFKGVAD